MLATILKLFGVRPKRSHGCVKSGPSPIASAPEPSVRDLPLIRREVTKSRNDVHPQEQSLLVSRLPVEIRLIIWELTVGREHDDDVLHLQPVDGILRHCRCFETDGTVLGFRHYCWQAIWPAEVQARGLRLDLEPADTRKIRSLLLTCKLLYQESVNILYRENIFDMKQIESIVRFPRVTLPQRLQHIRHIQFSTAFQVPMRPDVPQWRSGVLPDDHSKWLAACQTLAMFEFLETLNITIAIWSSNSARRKPADCESLLTVLEPLKLARATHFTVTLTEAVPEEVRKELGLVPYTLAQCIQLGI